jgi:hypothetical protein
MRPNAIPEERHAIMMYAQAKLMIESAGQQLGVLLRGGTGSFYEGNEMPLMTDAYNALLLAAANTGRLMAMPGSQWEQIGADLHGRISEIHGGLTTFAKQSQAAAHAAWGHR